MGDSSLLVRNIYSWVTFFDKNEERLTHLGLEDPELFTKTLYSVDTAKEFFLQECWNGVINPCLIDFNNLKAQILSRQYSVALPPVLKALISIAHPLLPVEQHKQRAKPTQVINKQGSRGWLVPRSKHKTLIHANVTNGHVQPPIWDCTSGKPSLLLRLPTCHHTPTATTVRIKRT
eukprot:4592015-Ditylum_brightwellii.AAC.1